MVVIVASLFLPFQPQFEITTTKSEVEALAKSKLVKTPISRHNPAEAGPNAPLRAKAISSSHSVTSPYLMAVDHNPATGEEPIALGSTNAEGAKPWGAFPVISSQLFMENLTSNASSSAIGTPANPVYNHGNTSVEEFFAVGSTARNRDSEGASDVYSTVSSPSGELANGGHTGGIDPTANLLKGVNKSLLYHSVLTGNASATALEGSKSVPNSNTHSTVITPRSKQLLEVNSSVSNISKIKPQTNVVPGLRWVNHKAPGAAPAGGASSNLKYPVQATDDESVELDGDETCKASKRSSSTRLGDLDDTEDYTFDDMANNTYTKDRADIPKFGGYSNNVKSRAQLLGGSYNVFATAPWKVVPSNKGNGGLRNALGTALLEKTIEHPILWVGTLGIPTDAIPQNVLASITDTFKSDYCCYPVVTDDLTFKGAYKNFCKQILWPTLNYQIPDNPNSKAFEDHSWNYYQYLNQQFADKIVEAYNEGDTVWVHDYHLMLVPGMVRKAIPNAKIGFFLHVSFPSSEVFRCFAQREKILEGILGANSVGFQTEEYARHFQQTANRLLMTDVDTHLLKYKGRLIAVESIPIGVDAFDLEAQIRSDSTTQWRKLIRERWSGKKLIVSRDQFDRIRGLCKKMLAYERFLKDNPHYIDQVVFIQICLGSGTDLVLERELMTVVDRINAMSKDISVSQPVVFLHQDLQFPQYLALGCEADLFLVSTMREGMNLTCHEFIVCSQAKNAPLLLSEFTGSAHVLNRGCFLINPWDIRQVSEVIKKGLELSKEEKRRRWKTLYKSVITHDSDRWVLSSLSSIANSWEANHERSKVYNLSFSKIQEDYMDARKHLFVLKISEPLNPRMLAALTDLCSKNIVFVINSFSRPMLERLYNRVPNLGLIAENGAYVRISGHWYHLAEDVSWKEDIIKVFEDKVERLPGSYYKLGETMIRFHTENAEDRERVSSVIGDAITHVNTLYGDKGIHAYVHQNIVFVQQAGLSVKAIRLILNHYNSSGETPNSAPLDTPLGSPRQSPDFHQVLSSPSTSESKTSSNPVATYFNKGRSSNRVEFLSVSGSSSPIIEPLFRFVNESTKRGEIAHGYTIAYGDTITTYAKQHIEGLNELFGILDKLTKL